MNDDDNMLVLSVDGIIRFLDLEDNEKKNEIVNELFENGRQSLTQFEEDLTPDTYTAAMNGDENDLMKYLKEHCEKQWKMQYGSSNEWFIIFLKQYQDYEQYQKVLHRIAQYGNKYMKNCPILSIVLQLLFEGIDDQCLEETNVFDDLWLTITNNGLKSISEYSDYIAEDLMLDLINKKELALFQALCEYYRPELFKLFKECSITDKQNLYNLAVDNVAENGWLAGVQAVKNKIVTRFFKLLLEKIPSSVKQQQDVVLDVISDDKKIIAEQISPPVIETTIKSDNAVAKQEEHKLTTSSDNSTSSGNSTSFDNSTSSDNSTSLDNSISSDNSTSIIVEVQHSYTGNYVPNDNKTNILQNTSINTETNTSVVSFNNIDPAIISSNNDNKFELNIILSCIVEQSELLQLEDLVQAGELKYINQTLKDISEKLINDYYKHGTFPDFIQDCITPIIYFLKRLQNLDDFMNTLTSKYRRMQQRTTDQSSETTSLSLRMLLHILFMNSDIFLRRILMSLLSKRNPVPFISPNIHNWNENERYEFMPAIIHVWDYTRPTILSFGIGPCKGKSTLLNQLFQSRFEQTVNSIYFQQTIDIDFGYCFNPERTLNIADTHGIIDKKLLRKISPLFDGFLIQIDSLCAEKQSKILLEYIEIIPQDKFQMIIIRDTPNQSLRECSSQIKTKLKESELDLSQKLHIYPLDNISNTNDRDIADAIEDLRDEILTKIREEISTNADRKDEILINLQKTIKKDYVEYLKKMDKIIQPLKRRLLEKDENQNQQNFPLYLKFQELCKVRQKLKKLDFYGSESENMFEINKKLFNLEQQLDPDTKKGSPIEYGFVFDSFIEILKSDNMLMSLDLLASELKYELSSLGGDKLAGDLTAENAFLSLEVLWRNLIVCYDHTTNDIRNLITNSYYNFISAGFPFEIIDGDNFHFNHKFLTKVLNEFASQRILVISIIGPQNSGKSTLLNYMFGTLFDVREGRCTRGIYASLVKLDKSKQNFNKTLNSKIPDIDYIMLIDTEGLLSIEKSDKEYDRRLVLFSLAISHLVIVNMMGDINETLKDMLTLCADSLKQIGVNTTNQPIVHFVLNQKADPNLKNHMEAINKIVKDLKEKELGEVIDISSKTFHTLPSAFKKERVSTDTKSPCFLRTEPDFIERTQQLCEKIMESAISSYGRSGDIFSDPPQWLKTAVNIFDTLQKFPDLTYFKDINERRQDDQIHVDIRELISKTLTLIHREKIIQDTCELTEHEIRNRFQVEFGKHQDNFDLKLDDIFKKTSASERIRERCKQFLKRQVIEICNAWCTAAIQVHDQKQMEGLVRDGSADLRNLINHIIKSGKTMTKEEATQEFEIMWKKKVDSIKNNFNPEERLTQAITFVYGNYNIFEKQCLPSHELLLQQLQFIIKLSKQSNMNNVISMLRTSFDEKASQLQRNVLERCWKKSDTNVAYTLATLHNFKHLDQQILINLHAAGTLEQETSMLQVVEPDQPNQQPIQKREKKLLGSTALGTGAAVLKNYLGFTSSKETTTKYSTTSNPTPLHFDFMKLVHDTIFQEMIPVSDVKSNILNVPKFFEKIIEYTMPLVQGNGTTRRPIEIDLIQKVVSLINTHINEINLELLVFKLLLSKQIKSTVHVHILILLTIFYYDEQKSHFNQQLSTLKDQKSSLLTYFISMIVPDAECDKEGAELFANKIKNTIQSNMKRDAQKIIARIIHAQENLNRKQIQTICDGKLQTTTSNNDDWLFRYIVVPTNIIVEEFQILWKDVEITINQQLEMEKKLWKNILSEFFIRIHFIISSLENEGSSVQYVDNIFEASSGDAAANLKNKGQCMALLLYTYLSGSKIEAGTSYTVFNNNYTLKANGLKLFEKLPPPSQSLSDLINGIKDVGNVNDNQMAIASITNLRLFLQSILDIQSKIEDTYDETPATFVTFDKDQIYYTKLLDKARGCTSKCPCCERPCDVDHTLTKSNAGNEDNRHACQTGHQLRAMAGIKFEVSGEASLFQCEQMTDEKSIVVRGTKKKWSEFKKDHLDWDFDNSITLDESFKLRGKFLNVWSKIGQRLCRKYDMKFVTENTPQAAPKPFHYILLLDSSGSMGGKPWNNLLDGVKEFINVRVDSGSNDRITIITFDDQAKYAYTNVDIKTVDIKNIEFMNGTTNFSNAFDLVIDVLKDVQLQNSTLNSVNNVESIIVFMSDGQAAFPTQQLDTLLTMKTEINQFWTVAFGKTRMDILEKINQKMNGTFKELKDSEDLVQVYAEIARY